MSFFVSYKGFSATRRKKRLTTKDTKDTKKNHLVTLSFVLFVSFVVNSLSCLNLCNPRNRWFLFRGYFRPSPNSLDIRTTESPRKWISMNFELLTGVPDLSLKVPTSFFVFRSKISGA